MAEKTRITIEGDFPGASLEALMTSLHTVASVLDENVTILAERGPWHTRMVPESLEVHAQRAIDIVDDRVYAVNRPEHEPCQAGTVGCSIDHDRDNGSCEGW